MKTKEAEIKTGYARTESRADESLPDAACQMERRGGSERDFPQYSATHCGRLYAGNMSGILQRGSKGSNQGGTADLSVLDIMKSIMS